MSAGRHRSDTNRNRQLDQTETGKGGWNGGGGGSLTRHAHLNSESCTGGENRGGGCGGTQLSPTHPRSQRHDRRLGEEQLRKIKGFPAATQAEQDREDKRRPAHKINRPSRSLTLKPHILASEHHRISCSFSICICIHTILYKVRQIRKFLCPNVSVQTPRQLCRAK